MFFIGVDLGTSSVKLCLMKASGEVVNVVSREYKVYFPNEGWSEQKPEDWFSNVKQGIKELIKDFDKEEIKAISFAGQMHGLVMLDANDNVIRPAILWNDNRSYKESDYINDTIGREKLSEMVGNISFAGFTAPKILWVEKNEPENFSKISKIMLPKDYISYKLSGVFATDVSDASGTLYFDVKNRKWSKDMCDFLGIKEENLPKVYESYEKVGNILPDIADELGLPKTCAVAIGAGDNAAAAIGMGIIGEGGCNISVGTSGTIFVSSKDHYVVDGNAIHSFGHADGGYHLLGCMLSAASSYKWWMENILNETDYNEMQKKITNVGHNSVFFLPYLMGERSPINDSNARGAFVGMNMDTTKEEMAQAVMEGVAFALRDSFERIKTPISQSTICGGGAKSELWRQIIADVLNITLLKTENDEGPSLGAAILASVAAGEYKNVNEAVNAIVKTQVVTKPIPENVKLYNERYKEFSMIYPSLKEFYSRNNK